MELNGTVGYRLWKLRMPIAAAKLHQANDDETGSRIHSAMDCARAEEKERDENMAVGEPFHRNRMATTCGPR